MQRAAGFRATNSRRALGHKLGPVGEAAPFCAAARHGTITFDFLYHKGYCMRTEDAVSERMIGYAEVIHPDE